MSEKHFVNVVVAVYADCDRIQDALERLREAGFSRDDISLVGTEEEVRQAERGYFYPPDEVLRGDARAGTALGSRVGAVSGMVTGLLAFLIPGIGPLAALGPLAGLIGGAAVGAAAGGPLGMLDHAAAGIEYRILLKSGHLILVAHCESADEERKAHEALGPTTPVDLRTLPYAS